MLAEGLTFPLASSQKISPLWFPGSGGPSLLYKNSRASEALNASTKSGFLPQRDLAKGQRGRKKRKHLAAMVATFSIQAMIWPPKVLPW